MKSALIINGASGRPVLLDITCPAGKGKAPVVLYAHGFNGFKDWGNFDLIADRFAAAGFTFVKFNFSHNGTTPEHPLDFVDLEAFAENNYTKELEDLRLVTDWIFDETHEWAARMDAQRLGLIGHSMGGGISILAAAEDSRIKALATWAAISQCKTPWGNWDKDKMEAWRQSGVAYYFNGRTRQEMPMHYQLFEDYKTHSERLDILGAAARIRVPFLICHGTEDTSVSIESAYALHNAHPAAGLFTLASDHVFGRKHPWTSATLPEAMERVADRNIQFFRDALLQ